MALRLLRRARQLLRRYVWPMERLLEQEQLPGYKALNPPMASAGAGASLPEPIANS